MVVLELKWHSESLALFYFRLISNGNEVPKNLKLWPDEEKWFLQYWDILRPICEPAMWCFLSNFISGISTTGPLGMGSTTTSTTLRTTTWSAGRSTTPSVPGRRNRSTSTPSPAAEVLDDFTTHLPSASSQIPAMEESCEAVEAREIMWFKTRQGQIAKQPCPAGTIGKPKPV